MPVDRVVAAKISALARAQHGGITWEQLLAAGLTAAAVKTRLARGELHRLHRGVYAMGDPALLPLVSQSAALLSLGEDSVLSHRCAAVIWSLANPDHGAIDATVIGGCPRPRGGVRIHRVAALDPRDIRRQRRLRLTSPARTLIDFAADGTEPELEHALAEARAHRLITDSALEQRSPAFPPIIAGLRSPGRCSAVRSASWRPAPAASASSCR